MQNTTFTELVSKVANKSYISLDGLEYYTENSYRKQINPGQNVGFVILHVCKKLTSSCLFTFWKISGILVPGTLFWSCSSKSDSGTPNKPESEE